MCTALSNRESDGWHDPVCPIFPFPMNYKKDQNPHQNHTLSAFLYSILPMLLYALIYEAVIACGDALTEYLSSRGAAAVLQHPGLMLLLTIAAAAACGLIYILPKARTEIAWRERKPGGISKKSDVSLQFAMILIGTICLAFSLNLILSLSGISGGTEEVQESLRLQQDAGLPLCIAVYGMLTPLAEESAFRAVGFSRLGRMYGTQNAALLSAALFGLYHGNAAQFIYAFVMGIVFALAYAYTNRFIVPYCLHAIVNIIMITFSLTGFYEQICSWTWAASFAGMSIVSGGVIFLFEPHHR